MKKSIFRFTLIATLILCTVFPAPVVAFTPPVMDTNQYRIWTEGINNNPLDQAEMLKALGLFIGSDKGFELDRHLTRAEAAVLIVRFMGEEKNAEAQANAHPFTDVPAWADACVGWLYQNEITAGISATAYGSTYFVTYWQFTAFLSRATMNENNFTNYDIGSVNEEHRSYTQGFNRGDVVALLTRYLHLETTTPDGQYSTIARYLARKGVFTAEQFTNAATDIYPIQYNHTEGTTIQAFILSFPLAQSHRTFDRLTIDRKSTFPLLLAQINEPGGIIFYELDELTLEETKTGRIDWPYADAPSLFLYPNLFDASPKARYFALTSTQGVQLVRVDTTGIRNIAEGKSLGHPAANHEFFAVPGTYWGDELHNERLCVQLDDSIRVLAPDGMITYPLPEGSAFLGLDYCIGVLYHEADGLGYIRGMDMATGNIVDEYTVDLSDPRFAESIPLSAEDIWSYERNPYASGVFTVFFGQAGLFVIKGERLIQVTDKPIYNVRHNFPVPTGEHLIDTFDANGQYDTTYWYDSIEVPQSESTE